MKIRGSSYFLILIIVLMVVIIISSLQMKFFTAKFLPLLFASVVLVLALLTLMRESKKPTTEGQGKVKEGLGAHLRIMAWILGTSLGIYLVGFLIVSPLFVLAYMKSRGIKWATAIIFSSATPVFIYGMFELAFKLELYRGLIFGG